MLDVESTLRRVALGARLMGAAWVVLLTITIVPSAEVRRPWVVAGTTVLVVVWAGLSVAFSRRDPWVVTSIPYLVADGLTAAATFLAPHFAGVPNVLFYGGYPLIAVVVAAVRSLTAGMVSALVLAGVGLVRLSALGSAGLSVRLVDVLSQAFAFVFAAVIVSWAVKVLRAADARRRHAEAARVRAEERAEMAAHLHDSVLQTLVLIQRAAADAGEVGSLARRQERELRDWLYGAVSTGMGGVAEAVHQMAVSVEAAYRIRVEVVTVGDAALDAALEGLVAAGREAVVNAAKHAKVEDVAVYLEVDHDTVALFVRDRGVGFDAARVPADRRGLRQSVVGRVERLGGSVELRTAPGTGTEVEMRLPR